jgi:hypothetical protein
MSFGSDAGTSGTAATQLNVDPYAPAQPALNQIVSEATTLYNRGATICCTYCINIRRFSSTRSIRKTSIYSNIRYIIWTIF